MPSICSVIRDPGHVRRHLGNEGKRNGDKRQQKKRHLGKRRHAEGPNGLAGQFRFTCIGFIFLGFSIAHFALGQSSHAADSVNRETTKSDSANNTDLLDVSVDRSPVDLALSPDQRWIVTTNQTSSTVSLIDTATAKVVDEIACGSHPVDLEFTPDGKQVLVTSKWSGTLHLFSITKQRLKETGSIRLGCDPHGLAISPDSNFAYVGLVATGQVAQVDLTTNEVAQHFDVGQWPKYMTLSPDGNRLAVGNGGDSNIMVVDTQSGKQLYDERLSNGTNLGQMRTSADGKYAYFTWMVYRTNPINIGNIQRGWVLASRIGRVRLDGPAYREAISLDVPRRAVADPHDLVISENGNRLVASSSGTHELLVYRLPDLPFVSAGGPGDLIDRKLQNDRDRFDRIEVGGRPMGMRMLDDSRTLYLANYLRNSVQVVDIEDKKVTAEIPLGSAKEITLARVQYSKRELLIARTR